MLGGYKGREDSCRESVFCREDQLDSHFGMVESSIWKRKSNTYLPMLSHIEIDLASRLRRRGLLMALALWLS